MIKKIIDSLPDDKKDHVLMGILTGFPLMTIGFIVDFIFGFWIFTLIGGIIALLLVGAKEIVWDGWMKKGNVEFLDFLASAVPILMMMLYFIAGLILIF